MAPPPTPRTRALEILLATIQRRQACLASYDGWNDRGRSSASPEVIASMDAEAAQAARDLAESAPALEALVATTRADAPAELEAWIAAHEAWFDAAIADAVAKGSDTGFPAAARAAWAEVRAGTRAYVEDSGGVTARDDRYRELFGIDPQTLAPIAPIGGRA